MKSQVRVDGKLYEVEIGDLEERPVKVLVEGELFEVWPIIEDEHDVKLAMNHYSRSMNANTSKIKPKYIQNIPEDKKNVRSPIPGTILSIKHNPGDLINTGQELCVIESMKMNNVIRANQIGIIKKVFIVPGQHVGRNDLLMEFE